MFDISWSELLVVAVLAVLIIGPEELPGVMRLLGRIVRRLQYVRYAFSQQFEDFMQESELKDIRKAVNFEAANFDEAAEDEKYLTQNKPSSEADNES